MESQGTVGPQGQAEGIAIATSLGSRLANVFAAPGDVFDEIKHSRDSVANWLVPTTLFIIVSIAFTLTVFSLPNTLQQIRRAQEAAIHKKVQQGKIKPEDEERVLQIVEKYSGPAMMKVFGSVSAIIASFVRLFWWAMVIWLMGLRLAPGAFSYMKAVEVSGMTFMIAVLGSLVSLLMIAAIGRLNATPTLAFSISDFDTTNRAHLALCALNPFNFWFTGVMAVALAKLSGVSLSKAAVWVFAYWLVMESLLILTPGMGQMAL